MHLQIDGHISRRSESFIKSELAVDPYSLREWTAERCQCRRLWLRKGIPLAPVYRQHAKDAIASVSDGDREGGLQRRLRRSIGRVSRFNERVAVDDGLTGLGYPSHHAV